MHLQHSLHYKESSRSYLGYTSAQQSRLWRQLARHPCWDLTGHQVKAVATLLLFSQERKAYST